MVGFGARSLIAQALEATGDEARAEEMPALEAIFLDHYRAHLADVSRPFPGVEETLARLKAGGARLGVLTNKPQELAEPLLQRLGLVGFSPPSMARARRPYTKPDPRIFHDVVAELCRRRPGGRGVMIGDSVTDLQTARAAGVPCILMSYGYTPVPAAVAGRGCGAGPFRAIARYHAAAGVLMAHRFAANVRPVSQLRFSGSGHRKTCRTDPSGDRITAASYASGRRKPWPRNGTR